MSLHRVAGLNVQLIVCFHILPTVRSVYQTGSGGAPMASSAGIEPCPEYANLRDAQTKPLPRLHDQFETRIEAKITKKGFSVDVVEYYDFPNNRGAVYRTKGGVTTSWLYDFTNSHVYTINGSDCRTSNISKSGLQFYNFTSGSYGNDKHGGHIGGVADLFSFGSQFDEVFVSANETVRGIPVSHWTSCLIWGANRFHLDFYFTSPTYQSPEGEGEFPVRAVLSSYLSSKSVEETEGPSFFHMYDFLFYRPGPIKDLAVFEVPRGVVCVNPSSTRTLPVLPDNFSMEMEVVLPQLQYSHMRKQYLARELNLSRYDIRPSRLSGSGWGRKYGYGPITIIHDFNTGLQYVVDVMRENCTVTAIPGSSSDSLPADDSHIALRHGYQLFDLDMLQFWHQGNRIVRGIPCEVWAAVRKDWPDIGTNSVVELYHTQANWSTESRHSEKYALVGLELTSVDTRSGYVSTWLGHVFNYDDQAVTIDTFDVRKCFPSYQQRLYMMFTVNGGHYDVTHRSHDTKTAVRWWLSAKSGVEPVRINDIHFKISSVTEIEIWFVMFEKPNITAVDDVYTYLGLEEGYSRLQKTLQVKQTIPVQYSDSFKNLTVKPGSLIRDANPIDADKVKGASKKEYTAGAMAGLAIAMLMAGVFFGILVTLCLRTQILQLPDSTYTIQD